IISDAIKGKIYFITPDLTIADSVADTGPVVDIDFRKDDLLACDIGVVGPNNGRFGKGLVINVGPKGQWQKTTPPILDSLQRPVQITSVDLDNDGKNDYLVS